LPYLQWPDEFHSPTPQVTFGCEFITLLESQVATGANILAKEDWSAFTINRRGRMVTFIRRGKLGYQRPECWEVRLADRNVGVQLGSLFGIRDYACVVTAGVDNIRTITEMWLNDSDVLSIVYVVPLWDKMNSQKQLKLPAGN
jgi:hypothetical protein